ncbi:hypothetical protein ACJ41O_013797 [Fusarium nematophilum]
MSQVKNLRAMFEGKGDTSPPDRGRSSGASTPIPGTTDPRHFRANGLDSPRPLSKVRTNFVAIEKDGRIGLRRDPSHESSVSRRRLSMETDTESVSTVPDKSSVAADDVFRVNKVVHETIPESPRQPVAPDKAVPVAVAAVTDKPRAIPDKKVDTEAPTPAPQPVEPAPASPTKATKPAATPATPATINGKSKDEKPKEPAAAAPAKANVPKKMATRPSTISTKSTNTKPPAKSPSAAKTPTSATHKNDAKPATKPATKPQEKLAVRKETRPASRAGSSATRPTAASAVRKPQPLKPATSETGFVKPKPKSPTKPVHLPASLMAPTASSGAKTGRQVRPSASSQNLNVPARSPSRASVSGTSAGKTVKRQASTIGRSRPSLGPPPKKTTSEHTKKEAPVDEGFLARMMRPTQASSSKTTEKVPVTPPRKTARRPSSSGTDHTSRRESNIKAPGSAKKLVRKQAESKDPAKSTASVESTSVTADGTETAPEPAVSEISDAAVDKTEDTEPVPASEEVNEPEPEVIAAEEAPVETASAKISEEVTQPVETEVPTTQETKEPSPEVKVDEIRPVTPVQVKEESIVVDVSEPTVMEAETGDEELNDNESKEAPAAPEPESETKENAVVVPPLEEDSANKNEVTPEVPTQETAAAPEPATEVKAEVVSQAEESTVPAEGAPAAEVEITENQPAENETTNKIGTNEELKADDAGKEKDTTAEVQTGEEKQETETVAKTD